MLDDEELTPIEYRLKLYRDLINDGYVDQILSTVMEAYVRDVSTLIEAYNILESQAIDAAVEASYW